MKRINNSEDGCEEEEGSNSNVTKRYECGKKQAFPNLKNRRLLWNPPFWATTGPVTGLLYFIN
jgi:hypothetical protein